MNNPILQAISAVSPQMMPNNLGQIKNIMAMLRGASNPQMLLQNMMKNNPQYKQVMDFISQNGGNPKEAFYKMAEQKGVNPDEILKMLQ